MENQNHLKKFRIKWVKNGMNLQWHFDPGGKNNIQGIKEKREGREYSQWNSKMKAPQAQPPASSSSLALAQALPCVCVCLQGGKRFWRMLSRLCRNRSGFLERFHRWAFHLPLHSCSHSARVCMMHHQSFQLPRPPFASPSICQGSPLPGHQPPPLRSNVSVMSSGLKNCDNLSKQ